MKKFFSIFIFLVLILSCNFVFASNMSQSEIISSFNSDITELNPDIFSNSDFDMSVSEQVNKSLNDYDLELSDINNYIYFVLYNESTVSRDLYFYDLGNSTIDNYSYTSSGFTLNTTGNINVYTSYVYSDDTDINNLRLNQVSNIFVPIVEQQFTGLNFDTVFTYSGNNIFTDSGSSGGLFDNIIAIMTSILAFIVPIATGLLSISLFKFIIYASVAIGIIYFVIRLIYGFCGKNRVSQGGYTYTLNNRDYARYKKGDNSGIEKIRKFSARLK